MADPIPAGYTAVTPYLVVRDAAAELAFITQAFGAVVHTKMTGPDGSIGHCDLSIDGAHVMMGQAHGPHQPMPAMIHLYVADADAVYAKAVAAGATADMPLEDQFYGDRGGSVKDVNGVTWWIATHTEDLTEDQIRERMKAKFGK